MQRTIRMILTAMVGCLLLGSVVHAQPRAICYNCPPEWADWGS